MGSLNDFHTRGANSEKFTFSLTRLVLEGFLLNYLKKHEILRIGSPGVEIVQGPRGSLLHTTRASQVPYKAKNLIFEIYGIVLIIPLLIPIEGSLLMGPY